VVSPNNNLATLHHFPPGKHPGFYSEGGMLGIHPDKDTTFFMSNLTRKEDFSAFQTGPLLSRARCSRGVFSKLPTSIESSIGVSRDPACTVEIYRLAQGAALKIVFVQGREEASIPTAFADRSDPVGEKRR